jgi:hypothetical protein
MSNELTQYSCQRTYMIKFQNDITIFDLYDTLPGVYAFNTRGVRKWIIGEKSLNLIQDSRFKTSGQF